MMLMYHATTVDGAKKIMKEGLRPKGARKTSPHSERMDRCRSGISPATCRYLIGWIPGPVSAGSNILRTATIFSAVARMEKFVFLVLQMGNYYPSSPGKAWFSRRMAN